jgi:transposase
MGEDTISHVGLDVHKKSIQVWALLPGGELLEARTANDGRGRRRLIRKLRREAPGEIVACYEAGPCGYVLQREMEAVGICCLVVAPSMTPRKPGERIKTDRRDAQKLAEMLRAGLLTEVHPPNPQEEAVRDLCRCRQDARQDLLRARHRLGKFLLRRDLVWRNGSNWTQAHRRWLRDLGFEREEERRVFEDYLIQVEQQEERVKHLERSLEEIAESEVYREPVGRLRCFRGVDTVTAMTVLAEIHSLWRFPRPRDLMAYLGLVPSEESSGEKRRQGAITKAGNSHVRHVLIQAAHHARKLPRAGRGLRHRREGQPAWVIAVADRAMRRLHRRYWVLVNRGKASNVAVVAVARELVGFLWAVLHEGSGEAITVA